MCFSEFGSADVSAFYKDYYVQICPIIYTPAIVLVLCECLNALKLLYIL